jgi:TonB family protein
MDASLWLKDLALYSLQVGIVVGLAAFVPAALRLRLPTAKLAYWHILLVACLLAPLASPWKQQVVDLGGAPVTATVVDVAPASAPAPAPAPRRFPFSLSQMALAVLAAGAAARLGLLAVGLVRLGGYRRRSRPLAPAPSWSPEADLRVSPEVASPVTFGVRNPVVLLPAGFPLLDSRVQDAILAHECLHVRRRDWLFAVVEELVRAVFWFHPAIWWLLGEIQLAREQAVDRAAVEMTQQREEYVDALLAVAGARSQMDLAPAPLFLRKWHLKYRVISIVEKEVRMSKTVLASALAVAVCVLAAACWMATSAFPLQAAPQVVADGPGVSVDLGGTSLLHRMPVNYPEAARMKGIEGTVVVQARLDTSGNVVDASVVSGPQELRRAALETVLQWHFAHAYGGSAQQVSIEFKLPKAAADAAGSSAPTAVQIPNGADSAQASLWGRNLRSGEVVQIPMGADSAQVQAMIQEMRQRAATAPEAVVSSRIATQSELPAPGAQGGVLGSIVETAPRVGGGVTGPAQFPQIRSIRVVGLPESAQNELLASLPVREGDMLTPENRAKLMAVIRQFDEHLSLSSTTDTPGQAELRILAPGVSVPARVFVGGIERNGVGDGMIGQAPPGQVDVQIAAPGAIPTRIRVGANVQMARLAKNVAPVYPPLAKQARIQGTVVLTAVIGKDGKVQDLAVVSGHALLIQAALDAVRQWQYHPTMLNAEPVEVSTQVEVNFTLPDNPLQP